MSSNLEKVPFVHHFDLTTIFLDKPKIEVVHFHRKTFLAEPIFCRYNEMLKTTYLVSVIIRKNNVQFGNNQMTLLTKKVNSSESESVCISGD